MISSTVCVCGEVSSWGWLLISRSLTTEMVGGGSAQIPCSGHKVWLFEVLSSLPFLPTTDSEEGGHVPGLVVQALKSPPSQELNRDDQ